jgi:dihydrofolate reductase
VDIAGRASAVRQALIANVIDEITLDIAPVLLGWGERIFHEVESFGFEPAEANSSIRCHARQVGTQQSESVGFWVQSPRTIKPPRPLLTCCSVPATGS